MTSAVSFPDVWPNRWISSKLFAETSTRGELWSKSINHRSLSWSHPWEAASGWVFDGSKDIFSHQTANLALIYEQIYYSNFCSIHLWQVVLICLLAQGGAHSYLSWVVTLFTRVYGKYTYPKCSMYGIYPHLPKKCPNVDKYSIHGASGL